MADKIAEAVSDVTEKTTGEDESSESLETATKSEEATTESDTSESETESSTVEESSDELEEFIPKEEGQKKDNVQRRIDQLTAELKSIKEENSRLKTTESAGKEPEYTESQLKTALKQAFDDGDANLAWEIIDYRVKKSEKDLISKYEKVETSKRDYVRQVNQEWEQVKSDYSKIWEDEDGNELYSGAKNDLDLGESSSLLYRLALEFYNMRNSTGEAIYNKSGGQRMAVSDAIAAILRKKKISPQDKGKKQLERALAKEKRKKSLSGSTSLKEETQTRKPQNASEKLADYIAERKKFQQERST